MSTALFVPVVLGVISVVQATLNRQVAREWGLAPAAILNTLVAVGLSLAFLGYCVLRGNAAAPGLFRVVFDPHLMRGYFLLPGCFGFALVVGLPWAVDKLGALPVFVALIGAQMVTSAVWDHLAGGAALSLPRVAGALLAVASVVLVNWK